MALFKNSEIRTEIKRNFLKQHNVTFTPKNVIHLFIVYELHR